MAEIELPGQASGKNPFEGLDFKKVNKHFTELRKLANAERREAQRTLSPGTIRNAIRSGKLPANLEVVIGQKETGEPFTVDDLKAFSKTRQRLERQYNKHVGVTMPQLVAASLPVDIERANEEIKSARVYRVHGDTLTFVVTASQKYDADWHQVRVQLMWWNQAMTGMRTPLSAVKKACQGAVKFDCSCGRHQYWYRYIANVGGFSLRPFEKDFPKIRNPQGVGCCCKHVLKTFKALMSPTVQAVLSNEMKRQAEQVGFGSDSRTKYLTKKDLKKLDRARPGQINQEKAKATLKQMEQVQKRFLAQLGKDSKKEFRKLTNEKRASLKKRAKELDQRDKAIRKKEREVARREKALQKEADAMARKAKSAVQKHKAQKAVRSKQPSKTAAIKSDLKNQLEFARMYNMPASTVYAKVADINNMSVAAVKKLAQEL
ncbi:hypothetical protein [Endozoicomonas lisbonensis]|uniref:ElaB/YqjD/DUF883 family membrane-anchored ribosome-binding protein n=1 Tax=Endozoicomonas lisbonensis TaxID=3120522 RepID=A0ABV2SPA5_9GAMM